MKVLQQRTIRRQITIFLTKKSTILRNLICSFSVLARDVLTALYRKSEHIVLVIDEFGETEGRKNFC